ncbi:DUF1186 domain-containing protein [Methylobacterium sp. BTF04]|uniref:DUF1186 domain-containing protein n=1 Tax=Methylobacterium sp. BTF04 TaxID=2708300 RepID=UPI0013D4B8EC|nr:DUF1186 domain-containing protein [Methylobacterium sp. BTF04]
MDRDLVDALSAAKHLPVAELRRALSAPESIADEVLRVLQGPAAGEEMPEADADLLFWGIHVLAAARDTRMFAPLVRLLHQDGETLDSLLGDAVTTTLSKILISTFDGDVAPLHGLILDTTLDDMVRNVGFAALTFLTQTGRVDRTQTHDLLIRFDDKRAAVEGDVGWVGWEETIALLGFRDLAPRAAAARKDGRLDDEFSDAAWFRTTLRQAEAKPDDLTRFEPSQYGTLDDPVAELAWTAEDAGQPVRNPFKDVGRNDPCPCGSGKKFKKCCLDTVV